MGDVLFAPPFLAHGQVTPNPKKWGANSGTPHFGPLGSLPLFGSFGLPSISGTPVPPSPTNTQPIDRKPTNLGANLN